MKKFALLVAIASVTASCGATTSSTSSFKVRMHGIHSPPPGAEGTNAPRSQTYLFNGVTLTKSDGNALELYEGDAKTVKIIDRGQIVYLKDDMSEYDSTAITAVKIKFDPTVVITSKNGNSSTLELSSGDLDLNQAFTVTKSKQQTVTIKIAWGDTISIADDGTETISAPTFTMTYDDGD